MDVPGRIENEASADLRALVLQELQRLHLEDPTALAERLDAVPAMVEALLQRDRWPLRTALTIADALELPIRLRVDRIGQPA